MNEPERIPGFQIVTRIGAGGMGEVFEAVRIGPGGFRKPVALKRLALDHALDRKAVERFLHEARISANGNTAQATSRSSEIVPLNGVRGAGCIIVGSVRNKAVAAC